MHSDAFALPRFTVWVAFQHCTAGQIGYSFRNAHQMQMHLHKREVSLEAIAGDQKEHYGSNTGTGNKITFS